MEHSEKIDGCKGNVLILCSWILGASKIQLERNEETEILGTDLVTFQFCSVYLPFNKNL